MLLPVLCTLVTFFFAAPEGSVQTIPTRQIPPRTLPTPDTVSPEMQRLLATAIPDNWNTPPKTPEEWKAFAATINRTAANLQPLRDRFGVKSEPIVVNGVKAYLLTPNTIPPQNRNRLLVHLHGGCYVLGGGEGATSEATYLAGYGHFKVLSIDYRRPPEFRYPAALDDAVSAWKAALKMADPKRMAIFGASAGGALTLSTVLRLKQEGLPLPAAIGPGTPMSDLTKTGDSFYTNYMVDNVLVGPEGRCQAMAEQYAGGHDLKDPMLSPVYGDMRGFPPSILTTGTRDLLLSNTVRVHRKLRQAGVVADLHVYEAQAHGHYLRDTPESKEVFEEMARFFDRHLQK
jgi:acetyl esterase/lipase